MFKQLKSAVFWYYLYKFRKRVIWVFFLLIIALFANLIYSDVVEYLKLKNRLEFLELALVLKWFIIIFNLTFSVYLIVTIFKRNEELDKKTNTKKSVLKEAQSENKKAKQEFSQREKDLLHKKKLRTEADILIKK